MRNARCPTSLFVIRVPVVGVLSYRILLSCFGVILHRFFRFFSNRFDTIWEHLRIRFRAIVDGKNWGF